MLKKYKADRHLYIRCLNRKCPIILRGLRGKSDHIRSDNWSRGPHKYCDLYEVCHCDKCDCGRLISGPL